MTIPNRMREAPGQPALGLLKRSLTHLNRGATINAVNAVISDYTGSPSEAREAESEHDSPSCRNPSDGSLLHCRIEPLPVATSIGHGVTPKRGPVDRAARCAGGRLPFLGMGRRDLSRSNHFILLGGGLDAAQSRGEVK